MRVPLWLAIALGVAGVGLIIAPYSAVLPLPQYQSTITTFGGIGGIIGALGLLREFLKDRKESIKERNQRLRQHTKILNDEVYKRLLHIFVEPSGRFCRKRECLIPVNEEEFNRYDLERRLHPLRINEIPRPLLIPLSRIGSLERGISHLKHPSYQDVYYPWTKLHSLIQGYNGLVDSLDEELTQAIRKQMRENLPTFTDWNSDTTSAVANFYYSGQINRFITEHVLSSLAVGRQPNFENSRETKTKAVS